MPQNANNVSLQAPYGYSISWGVGPTSTQTAGPAIILGQSIDNELSYDFAQVRDGRGTTVAVVSYDPHDSLTLEYVNIAGTGSYDNLTASLNYPTQGTMVGITNGDTGDPLSGSNWIIQGVTVRRMNTDASKIQLKAIRYAGVTQ